MAEEKSPLFTYAVRSPGEDSYIIVHHDAIPVFDAIADAEKDFRMYKRGSDLEHVIIDIRPLVERGIIPQQRLFGEPVIKGRV